MDSNNAMTVSDLMEFLHISRTTTYNLIRDAKLPCFRIGSDYRFLRSRILDWIDEQEQESRRPKSSRGRASHD